MLLKIVLPHEILLEQENVLRIVIETRKCSLGILPQRLDFAASLSPGVLIYETVDGERYLAIGDGLLTKAGSQVMIAVNKAVHGKDLQALRQMVMGQFSHEEERVKEVRVALAKLESAFIRYFLEMKHYG